MVHKKKNAMKNLQELYAESKEKAEADIKTFGEKIKPVKSGIKTGIEMAKKGFDYSVKGFQMTMGLQAKMMDKMYEEQAKLRKELEEGSKM